MSNLSMQLAQASLWEKNPSLLYNIQDNVEYPNNINLNNDILLLQITLLNQLI